MVDHEEKVSNYLERQIELESPDLRVNFHQLFSHYFVCCWKNPL